MVTLHETTLIAAPIERCFDLSRSIDLHMASTGPTGERAVGGRTSGLIALGERVMWKGRHFGVWFHHTSEIDAMTRPTHFRDSMVRGAFASFRHDHYFAASNETTVMRDVMQFAAPFGPIGLIAEYAVLRAYMRHFLRQRNAMIKRIAESKDWQQYLNNCI
jgi:ligand-binding SRPBCC domain-containing protein